MVQHTQTSKKSTTRGNGFDSLGMAPSLVESLLRMGYTTPTPVQSKVIPLALEGRDLIAMAMTGSGKTAAFLIPLISRLDRHSTSVGVRAVLLAPTRELAMQTATFAKSMTRMCDLRFAVLVGGVAMEHQFEDLACNPDFLVATPGRLIHQMIETNLSLRIVQMLVFDEADRLFEMGFEDDVRRILGAVNQGPDRQVMMFSATLPDSLRDFATAGLREVTVVRMDATTRLPDSLRVHFLIVRPEVKIAAVIYYLREILSRTEQAILFCATRHHVEFFVLLCEKLCIDVSYIYGTMDQAARTKQLRRFREKRTRALVVTDIAARGIDVPRLQHVINFDMPTSAKMFAHRAGRTARAGSYGHYSSVITTDDLPYVLEYLLFLGKRLRPIWEYAEQEKDNSAYIGGAPDISDDVDLVRCRIAEASDLERLYKSMQASYGVFNKTRPPAAKLSVRRARALLQKSGGNSRLLSSIHTHWSKRNGEFPTDDPTRAELLAKLRNVKFGFDGKFQVVSPETRNSMIVRKSVLDVAKGVVSRSATTNTAKGLQRFLQNVRNCEGAPCREVLEKKTNNDTPCCGDYIVDDGLTALRDGALTVCADEDSGMKKHKHVMKWNARKKRYQQMMVDRLGKVVKQAKRKNESGAIVRGDSKRSNLYQKWAARSKLSIQTVGEKEDKEASAAVVSRRKRKRPEDADNTINKLRLDELTKDKALIEAVEKRWKLTHGQARKLKRLRKLQDQSG